MSIDAFFERTRSLLLHYGKKQPVELGFNAFSIVSSQYRKENFHSDILREILDPSSTHRAHCLFLNYFRNFLFEVIAKKQNSFLRENLESLEFDSSVQVIREESRTDIAIVNEASRWVVIIENKINGAFDMYRQLPRYFEYWNHQRKLKVKAIIYLNAGAIKYPDTAGWSLNDETNINPLLIPIVGYSESEPNLVTDWLEKCIFSADSFDAKAVLSQYSRILIKQAGETSMVEMNDFAEAMWKENVSYKDLQEFVSKYPDWIAEEIRKGLETRIAPFTKLWIYSNHIVVLDGLTGKINEDKCCAFAIDITCDSSGISLSVFIRPQNDETVKDTCLKFDKGEAFLEYIEIMKKFGMSYTNGWRWLKQFTLPNSHEELCGIVNGVINNLLVPLNEQKENYLQQDA